MPDTVLSRRYKKNNILLSQNLIGMINFFFFFGLFRVTSVAYGGTQARSQIGAVAAGLHHSHGQHGSGSEPCLRPMLQLIATPDP